MAKNVKSSKVSSTRRIRSIWNSMVGSYQKNLNVKSTPRLFVCLMVVVLANIMQTAPLHGQERRKRVIIVETMPVPKVLDHQRYFIQGLSNLGYHDGENVEIVILQANGDAALAEELLSRALAEGETDLVVGNATLGTQKAKKALDGTIIPLLFLSVGDPVGAGIVQRIGVATGTNITGVVNTSDREKKIDLVMDILSDYEGPRPL
jgi:putative tryptophan/tyrosine transport system substrate-binding protein